jgi:hypothetical protein
MLEPANTEWLRAEREVERRMNADGDAEVVGVAFEDFVVPGAYTKCVCVCVCVCVTCLMCVYVDAEVVGVATLWTLLCLVCAS